MQDVSALAASGKGFSPPILLLVSCSAESVSPENQKWLINNGINNWQDDWIREWDQPDRFRTANSAADPKNQPNPGQLYF